ncbi:molybdopterin-guanine dinucleotide biosynthesis protein [Microbacteriaceae bacterium VKM Ac-2854]|nr:molybdopterin-guanine dinucleotide biosynthesis protein [Microbacteriaceae bacterium VKM Ac-2854]
MSTDDETAATLDAWWARLTAELGLGEVPIDRDALLGLAGVAAHSVVRPAAPLTTFLVGYAAGLAGGGADALTRAVEAAAALAREQRDSAAPTAN